MANPSSSTPVASDSARSAGSSWRRAGGSQFEWIAPSPSPVVIAELERLFPDVIQVPVHLLEEEEARWQHNAILARCFSRWVPPEAIVREFKRAGIPGEIEALSMANRHYVFRFSDSPAMETVLARPWVANGQPIAVAQWEPDFVPAASSLTSALLWIRLPQLPIEYWSEEILSTILSAAGQFLYSDDSTRQRIRGGFARGCVRVDLSKPLRPGVRIRGSRAPFWQQFSYENLDGICCSCGTLHIGGVCGASHGSSSSSAPPPATGFGPWMSAVRRRKAPPSSQPSPWKEAAVGVSAPSPHASQDGWTSPKKTTRRQAVRESSVLQSMQGKGSLLPSGARDPACRSPPNVPVGTVSLYQAQAPEFQSSLALMPASPSKQDPNPFSCLELVPLDGSDNGQMKSRMVGHSGPAKRARPVEPVLQRVHSKSNKEKGKGNLRGSGREQPNFTFSASSGSVQESGTSDGSGSKKSRRKAGAALDSLLGSSLSPPAAGIDHDSAVSLLKNVIQRDDAALGLDLARDDGMGNGAGTDSMIGGSHSTSDPSVLEVPGDMAKVPPVQSIE